MTPRNEAAFARKTTPALVTATTTPPIAGPTARAMFMLTPLSAAACGISSRPTSSGCTACHDGRMIAEPRPIAKVSRSTVATPIWCARVSAPSTAAAMSMNVWLITMIRRRVRPSSMRLKRSLCLTRFTNSSRRVLVIDSAGFRSRNGKMIRCVSDA